MKQTSTYLTSLKNTKVALVGLGLTGMSMLRYLLENGVVPDVYDSRQAPPINSQSDELLAQVTCQFGEIPTKQFADYELVLISPGISLSEPAIQYAQNIGIEVFCDIELFARVNTKPVIAVTASNGKSTVVAWLTDFLNKIGQHAIACGNFGVPVLDVIDQVADVYVMELSSFQLDTTSSLKCQAASVLNITPDHLDRYASFDDYAQSKRKIYRHAELVLANGDDELTHFDTQSLQQFNPDARIPSVQFFGLQNELHPLMWSYEPETGDLFHHQQVIGNLNQGQMRGHHNGLNALAVLALASSLNIAVDEHIDQLWSFTGLVHRCQPVKGWQGIRFIDDSKATNVASTIAAVNGLGTGATAGQNIILIAGGDAKGADLSELKSVIDENVKTLVALGKDKHQFEAFVEPHKLSLVEDMAEAVNVAVEKARRGDIVLLSPACASIDMFQNYQARAAAFIAAVHQVTKDESENAVGTGASDE